MTSDRSIEVSRLVDAPPERAFALVADPDRHPDIDASGMVRASRTHLALTELGDVFTMEMATPERGDWVTDNLVVVYEPDAAIGWATADHGEQPAGYTWTYRFTAEGDATRVTLTYDWSAVTDPDLIALFPAVDATTLSASLDLLAEALA